ncbi:hypothetical protein [Novosphingobium sp. ZW T3_23]|uniref:hypothetical protein n=1 Tax=Novosphingobium sp. ZW T3_23 TaxID=3378084 RepID=UPI003851C81C
MNAGFLNWIWHVKGSLRLAPEQTSDDVFERLAPLFRETGTSHKRASDSLTFQKKDPAAQDKMAVFENGVLQVEKGPTGAMLHYHLTSRALLFCFLAPLLFLGFAQITNLLATFEKPATEEASKKKPDQNTALPQNPIDKALGAPVPEKPKKKSAAEGQEKKHSPKSAYVFAGIFAVLYLVGRILEPRLVGALFRRKLQDQPALPG